MPIVSFCKSRHGEARLSSVKNVACLEMLKDWKREALKDAGVPGWQFNDIKFGRSLLKLITEMPPEKRVLHIDLPMDLLALF